MIVILVIYKMFPVLLLYAKPWINENASLLLLGYVRYNEMAQVVECTCHERQQHNCRQTSNISRTLVNNKIVDHSDVVGALTAGDAPTLSSFSI